MQTPQNNHNQNKNNPKKISKSQKGREAYYFGYFSEWIAVVYLIFKGYRIVKRNFKNPLGEVDIIAKKGDTLIAVEVKSRHGKDSQIGDVVTRRQCKRIINGMKWFLSSNPKFNDFAIRFDVVLVKPFQFPKHLENAYCVE